MNLTPEQKERAEQFIKSAYNLGEKDALDISTDYELLEDIIRRHRNFCESLIEGVVRKIEKYTDEHDDGMWLGREIIDGLLAALTNEQEKEV